MEACWCSWTPALYTAFKSPSTIPLHEEVSVESVDLESASVQGDTQAGVVDNVHTACTHQPPLSPQDRHPLFIPCFFLLIYSSREHGYPCFGDVLLPYACLVHD